MGAAFGFGCVQAGRARASQSQALLRPAEGLKKRTGWSPGVGICVDRHHRAGGEQRMHGGICCTGERSHRWRSGRPNTKGVRCDNIAVRPVPPGGGAGGLSAGGHCAEGENDESTLLQFARCKRTLLQFARSKQCRRNGQGRGHKGGAYMHAGGVGGVWGAGRGTARPHRAYISRRYTLYSSEKRGGERGFVVCSRELL